MKILLTGFGPYADTPVNPADKVVDQLNGTKIQEAEIVGRIMPNTFFDCITAATAAIAEIQPTAVVMLGEYTGRAMITVERIAQNFNDAQRYGVADGKGVALNGEPTAVDGPVAYWSTLPIRAMVKSMHSGGVPADISDAAGTFCCNHLMYGVLHHIATAQLPIQAGWIHLPCLPEVAALPRNIGLPSMNAETATMGVRLGIEAILNHPQDITEASFSRLQI